MSLADDPLSPDEREALRALIFTRSLLPLLEVVMDDRPAMAARFARTRAAVQFRLDGADEPCVHLDFNRGALRVVQGRHASPDLDFVFDNLPNFNGFFAGKAVRPKIRGLARHPLLLWRTSALLGALRILTPEARVESPEDRALYVKLVLRMITRAMSLLHRGGHPGMRQLAADSPDRVYQWTVVESGEGVFLRMHAGRVRAGRGVYGRRRPFVSTTFPTVDAAFRVFTTTGSQMEAVVRGDVVPEGSPEYSRKISLMMQQIDALLTGE